jgi:hypothetical protein
MKKVLFFILLILSVNITATVCGMEIFDEKVTYTHTAQRVPSRVSIVMVPTAKSESYLASDVFGMTGGTFNTEGAHILEILPRSGTPTGEYTLIVSADGVKSKVDIKWLSARDKEIYDALNEINSALYQNLEEVIRKHIDLMPSGFTMANYEALHVDYRTNVMKALAANYTHTTLEQFKAAFDSEVSKAKSAQDAALNKPTQGGGGGGGGSSSSANKPYGNPAGHSIPDKPQTTQREAFKDLRGYTWALEAIDNLSQKGIVSGDGNGNFMPQNNVNRAEFSTMIVRLLGISDDAATVTFDDVDKNDWFYVYVASAKKAGIINGRSETQFSPADNITRAEAVIMIHNVLKSKGCDFAGRETVAFTDISELNDATREKVLDVASIGIIMGRDKNTFAPQDKLTRAEAAVIINKIIKFI